MCGRKGKTFSVHAKTYLIYVDYVFYHKNASVSTGAIVYK